MSAVHLAAPKDDEDSSTDGASVAVSDLQRQAEWKQNWLEKADQRGALWHARWKQALEAKQAERGLQKRKKSC